MGKKEVSPLDLAAPHERIGSACTLALLLEVSATPKPGLVDRLGNGAHRDMDFSTFLASAAAIAPYFSACALAGQGIPRVDGDSLGRIRPLGVACEQTMLAATGGANTHKGAIFSLGILACAAGYCREREDLSPGAVCGAAKVIAAPAVADFDAPIPAGPPTKGRELYRRYGIRGIRGEAASGFLSVRQYALPVMASLAGQGYPENDIHLQALLSLMANVQDTNVLARGGQEGLRYVRDTAREVLELGGALTPAGKERLLRLDEEYIRRNLSPGGCADLLAIAIFLEKLPALFPAEPAA